MRVRVQANSVRQKFSSSCTSTFLGSRQRKNNI